MITSSHNPKIKRVRELQSSSRSRKEAGAFVVEGMRLVEEALASEWPVQLVLYTEDLDPRGQKVLQKLAESGAAVESVSESVMRFASDTQTPQGLLAVITDHPLELPKKLKFVFIPDSMRDPGNLGSMLRSAAAAGVDAAFLPPGTVDAFSPKVLRAGMGAQFRIPVLVLNWEEIVEQVGSLAVWLADAHKGPPYYTADFRSPLALIVGGEATGASPQARQLATSPVCIPMPGSIESLNAAAAAAILLFEVARQQDSGR